MEPITVYVKTQGFCGPCKATKTALDRAGISYVLAAIEEQPTELIEDFKIRIGASAPIVITPNAAWSGFRPDLIPAPAIARYDTNRRAFTAALARYNHDAYGDSAPEQHS